jgi:hypothetical protein
MIACPRCEDIGWVCENHPEWPVCTEPDTAPLFSASLFTFELLRRM